MAHLARTGPPLRVNPDVLAKRLDETTVLVHIGTNRIFELNVTGARIWELLCQGVDANRIPWHLANEFEVEESRAADEVRELVTRLQAEGLLES